MLERGINNMEQYQITDERSKMNCAVGRFGDVFRRVLCVSVCANCIVNVLNLISLYSSIQKQNQRTKLTPSPKTTN